MTTIGHFTKTQDGFDGTIYTLAVTAEVALRKNTNKQQDCHPDYEVMVRDRKIGAAWTRDGKRGRYISVSFDEPSFAPGFYSLTKTGVEHGYTLTLERPKVSK